MARNDERALAPPAFAPLSLWVILPLQLAAYWLGGLPVAGVRAWMHPASDHGLLGFGGIYAVVMLLPIRFDAWFFLLPAATLLGLCVLAKRWRKSFSALFGVFLAVWTLFEAVCYAYLVSQLR